MSLKDTYIGDTATQNITVSRTGKAFALERGKRDAIRKGHRAVSEVWQYFDLISIYITFHF